MREAYEKQCLPGSVEKDVVAEDLFKAAGAEIGSRSEVVSQGMILVGAPSAKRLGLSLLTLRIAALKGISTQLASRLASSWVSVLLFRRCLSSVVAGFSKRGQKFGAAPEKVSCIRAGYACLGGAGDLLRCQCTFP